MKKHVFGRQFKRDINERKALFRGLVSELVMHEKIATTEEKAKAIRRTADKLVTKAKLQDTMHATSLLQPFLSSEAVKKMLGDIALRFADRQGGYTRIIRLGRRFNDNAQTVRMEWVSLTPSPIKADSSDKSSKKAFLANIKTAKPSKTVKKLSKTEPKKKTVTSRRAGSGSARKVKGESK